MSLIALGLLLLSAVLHAAWNLLLKQAGRRYVVLWGALAAGSALFLPVLLLACSFPGRAWRAATFRGRHALTGIVPAPGSQ